MKYDEHILAVLPTSYILNEWVNEWVSERVSQLVSEKEQHGRLAQLLNDVRYECSWWACNSSEQCNKLSWRNGGSYSTSFEGPSSVCALKACHRLEPNSSTWILPCCIVLLWGRIQDPLHNILKPSQTFWLFCFLDSLPWFISHSSYFG